MARRPITSAGAAAAATASRSVPSSDDAEGSEEVTRCICGNEEFVSTPRTQAANANPGLFVQCEKCHVWQHGFCVGFLSEEDVPGDYYCEQCEPSYHNISMRHGILVSRYRPVKRSHSSRSPRKSRSREAESTQSPAASDGEQMRDAASSAEAGPRNGALKAEPGLETSATEHNGEGNHASAMNGGSRRSTTSEKPGLHTSKSGDLKRSDSQATNQKGEPQRAQRSTQRGTEGDGGATANGSPASTAAGSKVGSSAPHRPGREPASPSPSPRQSRDNSEEPVPDTDNTKRAIKAEGSLEQEVKAKRSRRKNSEEASAPLVNPVRGRMKRRSREEEILQRVLEESAREARELEARRRSQDNGEPYEQSNSNAGEPAPKSNANEPDVDGVGSDYSDAETRKSHMYTKPSKRQRSNADASERDNEDEDEGEVNAGDDVEEPSRRSRARSNRTPRARPGRKSGSRHQNSQQRLADKQSASSSLSRRTPNGVKKCRPRIPSPRSTFQEMRRRVATILEFSGRTQVEMAEERQSRVEGPFEVASRDGDFEPQLQQLAAMGDHNTTKLEELTRKLLTWEEQFGAK